MAPVTVIIPCFNCADTIERAVASVAVQTARPAQLIIANDASTDDSLEVIGRIRERYGTAWCHVVNLPSNMGPASARNAGWNLATQPYIAFLDADDSWHEDKIKIQYQWMSEHPNVALSGHRYVVCDEAPDPASPVGRFNAHMVGKILMLLSNRFSTPTVMLKRDVSCRFAEGKRHAEDYLLWLQIVFDTGMAGFLDASLAFLHKPVYGRSGLSARMWEMEKGELDTYKQLYRADHIRFPVLGVLITWSLLKYFRRLVLRFCASNR